MQITVLEKNTFCLNKTLVKYLLFKTQKVYIALWSTINRIFSMPLRAKIDFKGNSFMKYGEILNITKQKIARSVWRKF